MDQELLNVLLKGIIAVVSVLISSVIIPLIKCKVDAEKLAKIEQYTTLAVRCAEQIYTPDQWEAKKNYVLDYISAKAFDIGIKLTGEDINNLIEGIVNEVKKG